MNEAKKDYSEEARALARQSNHGTLATLDAQGYPYTSLSEVLVLENGDLVMFLSNLSAHTSNLKREPKASVLLAQKGLETPLAGARLSLLGKVKVVQDRQHHRVSYLEQHPQAKAYIDFADFDFYRLRVGRAYYIGGFGKMGWLDMERYRTVH